MPFSTNADFLLTEKLSIIHKIGLEGFRTRLVGTYMKEQLSQNFLSLATRAIGT